MPLEEYLCQWRFSNVIKYFFDGINIPSEYTKGSFGNYYILGTKFKFLNNKENSWNIEKLKFFTFLQFVMLKIENINHKLF